MKMHIFTQGSGEMDSWQTLSEPEWMLATGDGGFAAGTWSGIAVRNYHGWFTAAFQPPTGRRLLLSHIEEVWSDGRGKALGAGAQLYRPGVLHPRGFEALESFSPEPLPTWIWRFGGARWSRRLVFERGGRGGAVEWRLLEGDVLQAEMRPFLSGRSFHGDGAAPVRGDAQNPPRLLGTRLLWKGAEDLPTFEMDMERGSSDQASWRLDPVVHEQFWRREEELRGYAAEEDLFSPAILSLKLDRERPSFRLRFGMAERPCRSLSYPAPAGHRGERLRGATRSPAIAVPGSKRPGILAGYPWFGEWGRDTMIAIPGLALADGHCRRVHAILEAWLERLDEGLLPNRLLERQEGVLDNSADASLFFLRALRLMTDHLTKKEEAGWRRRYLQAVAAICRNYLKGTRHGIGVDGKDGLLRAGNAATQLTWMDAQSRGKPVTPRFGKCVELNALFYDGLRLWQDWADAESLFTEAQEASGAAEVLARSFEESFWAEEVGYYADLAPDAPGLAAPLEDRLALRPNQLFALSAAPGLVSASRALRALDTIDAALVTPFGLRTLTPADGRYRGRYRGDQDERDAAYHQGTAWPWLVGPYIDAALAVHGVDAAPRLFAFVEGVLSDLDRGASGHLSELAEADPPHDARGAFAQAWSAAEVFRVRHRLAELLG